MSKEDFGEGDPLLEERVAMLSSLLFFFGADGPIGTGVVP